MSFPLFQYKKIQGKTVAFCYHLLDNFENNCALWYKRKASFTCKNILRTLINRENELYSGHCQLSHKYLELRLVAGVDGAERRLLKRMLYTMLINLLREWKLYRWTTIMITSLGNQHLYNLFPTYFGFETSNAYFWPYSDKILEIRKQNQKQYI